MTPHASKIRTLTAAETQQHIETIGIDAHGRQTFVHRDEARNITYDWHSHRRHQLLYAISGILRVETRDLELIVSPQRALWIPANTLHRTRLENVACASVFISPRQFPKNDGRVRIVAAPSLMREMILYALRWGPSAAPLARLQRHFFQALCALLENWLADELPCALPRTDHLALNRALRHTQANLQTISLADAARAAAVSERTLRRLILEELQMPWREYLNQSRMMRAMELLCQPSGRVAAVAEMTGFQSMSAFSARFRQFTGETPREFRRRTVGVRRQRAAEV